MGNDHIELRSARNPFASEPKQRQRGLPLIRTLCSIRYRDACVPVGVAVDEPLEPEVFEGRGLDEEFTRRHHVRVNFDRGRETLAETALKNARREKHEQADACRSNQVSMHQPLPLSSDGAASPFEEG